MYHRSACIYIYCCLGDCAAVALTSLLPQTWKTLLKSTSPRPTERSSNSTVSWSCRDSLTCLIRDRICLYVHCLHLSYLTVRGTTVGGTGRAPGLCTKHSTRMVNVWSHHMHLQTLLLEVHSLSMYYVTLFPNLCANELLKNDMTHLNQLHMAWLFALLPTATPPTVQIALWRVRYHIYQMKFDKLMWSLVLIQIKTGLSRDESCSQLQTNLQHNATQDSIFKPM